MMTTSFAFGRCGSARAVLLYLSTAVAAGGCTEVPLNTYPPAVVQQPAPSNVTAGFYRVNPGDTLASIATAFGQRAQDIAAWNRMPVTASVVPGQVLRVASPPAAAPGSALPGVSMVSFLWPAQGAVVVPFEVGKSKGIVIAGSPGQAVTAAADGRVVYVGSGIKEYGPLIVIKHNDNLVSAYGHAGRLLVNEGDVVRAGQEIGEMGTDESGRSSVEFEIRRDGTPVDPLIYLP